MRRLEEFERNGLDFYRNHLLMLIISASIVRYKDIHYSWRFHNCSSHGSLGVHEGYTDWCHFPNCEFIEINSSTSQLFQCRTSFTSNQVSSIADEKAEDHGTIDYIIFCLFQPLITTDEEDTNLLCDSKCKINRRFYVCLRPPNVTDIHLLSFHIYHTLADHLYSLPTRFAYAWNYFDGSKFFIIVWFALTGIFSLHQSFFWNLISLIFFSSDIFMPEVRWK